MPSIEQRQWTPQIGRKLDPVEPVSDPIVRSVNPGAQPTWPSYPRFQVTSLPLSVIYQPDALRQFYRGGVPQSRIIPIPE